MVDHALRGCRGAGQLARGSAGLRAMGESTPLEAWNMRTLVEPVTPSCTSISTAELSNSSELCEMSTADLSNSAEICEGASEDCEGAMETGTPCTRWRKTSDVRCSLLYGSCYTVSVPLRNARITLLQAVLLSHRIFWWRFTVFWR